MNAKYFIKTKRYALLNNYAIWIIDKNYYIHLHIDDGSIFVAFINKYLLLV